MGFTTAELQAAVDANQRGIHRCTWCNRRGVPYEHNGIQFDGLHNSKGERLCSTCTEEDFARNGIDILVIDGRIGRAPYVYNTVRDKDLAIIRCEFGDGRDRHSRRRPKKGK